MAQIDIDGGVPATTLLSSITASDSAITFASGTGYPDGTNGLFYIVIDRGLSTQEVVECSARAGDTVTAVTRGDDGSTATSHAAGAAVEHVVPAKTLQEMNIHTNQSTGTPHGAAYLGTISHAAIPHTNAMMANDAIENDNIVTMDAAKLTGTAAVDTTGNAATATLAATATQADNATTADSATTATSAGSATLAGDVLKFWADWTPVLTQGVTVSTTINRARYQTIGSLAIVQFNLTATSAGTNATKITISGLPEPLTNVHFGHGTGVFQQASGATPYELYLDAETAGATPSIEIIAAGARDLIAPGGLGGFFGVAPLTEKIASGTIIRGIFFYETS